MATMDVQKIVESLSEVETRQENGIVLAKYQGTWMGVTSEEVWKIMRNYNTYIKVNKKPDVLSRYENHLVLVCTDQEVFLSKSRSELLRIKLSKKDEYAYIGVLGINPDDSSNFSCFAGGAVFVLGDDHKPSCFNSWDSRTISQDHESASVAYVANTRRWATVYLELSDKQWRKEFFLLDTGAPSSFCGDPLPGIWLALQPIPKLPSQFLIP
ncbi:MAG: hypothetical protein EOP48_08515 [Sphingobacteriales bacterium]|nr:MAG: hypothetical protein EOP48_08515 [Sphingobacteriales bacterium]